MMVEIDKTCSPSPEAVQILPGRRDLPGRLSDQTGPASFHHPEYVRENHATGASAPNAPASWPQRCR
jgi:hypothetical protein